MNGWDGRPDLRKNKYEDESDRPNQTPVPCNAVLITKQHKKYQTVWFSYMKAIWDNLEEKAQRKTKRYF
jgi:hypothetical protein